MNAPASDLARYWRLARRLPPRVLLRRMVEKLKQVAALHYLRTRDRFQPTYLKAVPVGTITCHLEAPTCARPLDYAAVVSNYLEHRFDLLGSGWTQVRHGMRCRGVFGHRFDPLPATDPDRQGRWLAGRINAANLAESQGLWQLIYGKYDPIDWQIDFKSGYRWQETIWFRDIRYGHLPGADVKVPWELGRLQHLPQLAIAYGMIDPEAIRVAPPAHCMQEFRNQVLDFLALNPPRFGVNWACTMDVGIRAANLLVAYNLFRAYGASFDEPFEQALLKSVQEHGRHIVDNLEWSPSLCANHYLANIAGLIFVAAYLPTSAEADAWLALGIQELVTQVKAQFLGDGGNFEASTSYHRLSAEMVIYSTALLLGLPAHRAAALDHYDFNKIRKPPFLRPAPLEQFPVTLATGRDEVSVITPFAPWYFERIEPMFQQIEPACRARTPSRKLRLKVSG